VRTLSPRPGGVAATEPMPTLDRLRRQYGFRIKTILAMVAIVMISSAAGVGGMLLFVIPPEARANAAWSAGIAIALGLAASVVVAVLMVRRLLRPLDHLLHGTRAVTEGNLQYRFSDVKEDEWGELAEALDEMLRSLHRDSLTGLLNQRSFHDRLEAEIARSLRYGSKFSVMMLDLDHFKTINDRWGHSAGNDLLREAATVIASVFRDTDVVARYGGDEFAAILPETDETDALEVAERLRRLVEQHRFAVSAGPPNGEPGDASLPGEVFVTVSVGVAEYPAHGARVDALLMAADLAMFRAKHGSRNSVCGYGRLLLSLNGDADTDDASGGEVYNLLEQATLGAIETLAAAVEARDQGMREHSESVTRYAMAVAEEMGFRPEEMDQVRTASLLHDVGKIAIPDAILNHPGRLNPQERVIVERHASIGAAIVSKARQLAPIAKAIEHHHECYDGTGYPDGLAGDQIPLLSRLVAVVDAYEAMTRQRPYRRQLTREEAVAELRRCAGGQFDPEIVAAFTRLLERVKQAGEPALQAAD